MAAGDTAVTEEAVVGGVVGITTAAGDIGIAGKAAAVGITVNIIEAGIGDTMMAGIAATVTAAAVVIGGIITTAGEEGIGRESVKEMFIDNEIRNIT